MTTPLDAVDRILNRLAAERGPDFAAGRTARVGPGTFAAINRGERAVGMPVRYRGVGFAPDPAVEEGVVWFDGEEGPER